MYKISALLILSFALCFQASAFAEGCIQDSDLDFFRIEDELVGLSRIDQTLNNSGWSYYPMTRMFCVLQVKTITELTSSDAVLSKALDVIAPHVSDWSGDQAQQAIKGVVVIGQHKNATPEVQQKAIEILQNAMPSTNFGNRQSYLTDSIQSIRSAKTGP